MGNGLVAGHVEIAAQPSRGAEGGSFLDGWHWWAVQSVDQAV